MYKVLKTEGRAKRGELVTVHGTVQTPVFMNVGTVAAIKGAVAADDLEKIGTQIELSNTFLCHHCVRSRKRACFSSPTLTEGRFSWDRSRVCRFSPI